MMKIVIIQYVIRAESLPLRIGPKSRRNSLFMSPHLWNLTTKASVKGLKFSWS